ncbi:reverse transcriptase domain-containing protein [Tanacetum coccineum]
MGTTLTANCKRLLTDVLHENIETTHDTRQKTGVERKGVPLAKGRDDQKGLTPKWDAHTIPVKLANKTWKKGEELASLIEYPYKCFLRLPKENSQIIMAENDEEKIGFHTEEGVYYFTHMPKGLKNSAATLEMMMEKVLADQRGRSVEVYLEEIVVKSKSEQSLVQDVEETLIKLKRVNIKIDPNTSSFGVEEGRFLGHMVTKEGVRADPEKVQEII